MKRLLIAILLLLAAAPLIAQGVAVGVLSGTSDPSTCQTGSGRNLFINRSGTPVLKLCTATNVWSDVGAGNVVGPASATDEAIVRYDGTTGKLTQDSPVTIGDAGAITMPVAASIIFGAGTLNTIRYLDGTGPLWRDNTTIRILTHNVQALSANRTVTWQNVDGTIALTSSNVATATALAADPTDCAAGQFATTIAASGNLTCSAVDAATNLNVSTGITNGTGMQHTRGAGCTTAATINATCDTTITWPVAFADTNYTAIATLDSPSGGLVFILSTKNKTATTIDVTLVTLTAAASSGTINLIGMHD
jgi:hypothetical protein